MSNYYIDTQDTSLDVSFHCSLAPSYPRAIHPPQSIHSSLVPFVNPPSLPQPSLPPLTLRACVASLLPLSLTLLSPSVLLSLPPLVHPPTITLLPPLPPLPPSLPLFLPPSILPRPFPVSHHRFLPPSRPLLPPSLPPSILPRSFPAPRSRLASCRATQYALCVYTVLASCTGYCLGRAQP